MPTHAFSVSSNRKGERRFLSRLKDVGIRAAFRHEESKKRAEEEISNRQEVAGPDLVRMIV
jgi:hypothetical protein